MRRPNVTFAHVAPLQRTDHRGPHTWWDAFLVYTDDLGLTERKHTGGSVDRSRAFQIAAKRALKWTRIGAPGCHPITFPVVEVSSA